MSSPSLEIRPLSQALQKKAIAELNENPSRIADDLKIFKEWIQMQPHIRSRMNDQFLIAFLRGCKYSLEKAKKKLDTYYTMRTNLPDLLYSMYNEQKMRAIMRMSMGAYLPLPLGEDGPRIVLMRPGNFDPDIISIFDIIKLDVLVHDILMLEDDNCVVSGFIHMVDMAGFTTKQMMQLQPTRMKRIIYYMEGALPVRTRSSHMFNTGSTFETIFNMMKPMLPDKVKERMVVHPTMESVYEKIPLKYFPKEYGGENGSIEEIIAAGEEMLMKYREFITEEKHYGTDEKLRPGKPIDFESMFGLDGSFRKLEVD
ncbi:alpha-tocopherol transfer protein-like [Haematobia irritans]|uniref:alpha-tocopherol transfer protein-like n=1 Tax=Haematobia irritans TaxID=7368 RepID=UPI003F50735A